jgi:hypothetical protein
MGVAVRGVAEQFHPVVLTRFPVSRGHVADHHPPAGAADADHFGQNLGWRFEVVERSAADHDGESAIREGHGRRVALDERDIRIAASGQG